MSNMPLKTDTDLHWNDRAVQETDTAKVNIADGVQRALETEFILKHLNSEDHVLEVGCGNGFLTNIIREHVAHVDGFDYAENMVHQAKRLYAEKNNSFFHDNLLDPQNITTSYDKVVCVRVLINLQNLEQQKIALKNLVNWVKPGGMLLLVEGYSEGFANLNELRENANMEAIKPAAINYYSKLAEILPLLESEFDIADDFHTGMFDFLTRIIYPCLAGAENAQGPGEFHDKIYPVAKSFNPASFTPYARLRGFALVKR